MISKYRYYLIVIIFWMNGIFLFAQNSINDSQISTMQGLFSRTVINTQSGDSIAGKFYYDAGKIFFKVDFPLNQIMIIEKNLTLIYYPDSNEGFELESINPVVLPLVTGILAAIREDYGLSIMGFKIFNQRINDDTLKTYWSYPPAPEKAGKYIVTNYMDRLFSVEYQAPDSTARAFTFFKEYANIDDLLIPLCMESRVESPIGLSEEIVYLSKVKINSRIADEVRYFKIPESVELKQKKW